MTWQNVVIVVGVTAVILSTILLAAILYVLLTGADKRYREMRSEHLAQRERVRKELERSRRHV